MKEPHLKRILSLSCVLFLPAAVLLPSFSSMAEEDAVVIGEEQTEEVSSAAGTAWTDSSVEGLLPSDIQIRPQDDYYSAVNRDWILSHPLPEGQSEYTVLTGIAETVAQRKFSLAQDTSLKGHNAELVQGLFHLLLDWDARNMLGLDPILPSVQAIRNISSLEELRDYLCNDTLNFLDVSFTKISISQYINNPDYYAVEVSPTPLLLSDSADYASISSYGRAELAAAQSKSYYMLERTGCSEEEAADLFDKCLVLESVLAKSIEDASASSDKNYSTVTSDRPCARKDLVYLAGRYPIADLLDSRGLGSSSVYSLPQPGWLSSLGQLWSESNLPYLKAYLLVHTLLPAMELTDEEAFYVQVRLNETYGRAAGPSDAKAAAFQYVQALLPEPLDSLYVERWCTEREKQDVKSLVNECILAYRSMLGSEDWISDSTKREAIKKLENLTVRVSHPDTLPDYSALSLRPPEEGGTLVEAFRAIRSFSRLHDASLVNQRFDDSHWTFPSSTVNCFYNPQDNSINIPAGMLEAPFYSEDMTKEQLLGGIGTVIGHEISHAFDQTGSRFDESGNLRNWWTPEDAAAFAFRTSRVSSFLSSVEPFPESGNCPGDLEASEATADLAGMKCILLAAGKEPSFDYDSFFRSYAGCWAGVRTELSELLYLYQDEHPLAFLRVNGVLQQYQEFYDTYDVKPTDGMYLSPENRIFVW